MEYKFSVQAMVRGYHIYQNIWDAACGGELLNCERLKGNLRDPSAVAVKKGTRGNHSSWTRFEDHLSIFICRGGVIVCRVNGSLIMLMVKQLWAPKYETILQFFLQFWDKNSCM